MLKKIPYGLSDFKDVKTKGYYYIDKTPFIKKIEDSSNFLFFLRPRRFGKSLLISMLEAYYDIYYKDEFQEIFKETYILNNQTELKSSFYIMRFDFSGVSSSDYQNSFRVNLLIAINRFLNRYKISINFINQNPIDRLNQIFNYISTNSLKLYILIDEYDSFVNKLLVNDINIYKDVVTTKDALYKDFFTMLKVGTSGNDSAIKKMFFTGVSPLALYDVTSGSNIGKNLSLEYHFNNIVGITKEELDKMIDDFNLTHLKKSITQRCNDWYDNYRFNEDVKESIYNTDMILYYLDSLINTNKEPKNLIDVNVRTDYTKLRYLVYSNKKLNGNFEILNSLINNEKRTLDILKDSFSAFELKKMENFISFLFSLGFVTIQKYRASIKVSIPNQTIKKIMADFIEYAYRAIDFYPPTYKLNDLVADFAYDKRLDMFFFLNGEIKQNSSIRDYIKGESHIKASLITYLCQNNYYEVRSEVEANKGFIDILLNPIQDEISYGAIIELKYLSKKEYNKKRLKEKIKEAKEQLEQYEVEGKSLKDGVEFVKVVLVYRAWELVYCKEVKKWKKYLMD